MNNFKKELITVKKFFRNKDIDISGFTFSKKEEPCDIFCVDTGQQFQVTWNEHKFQGEIRKNGFASQKRNLDEVVDDFIVGPICKKIKRYGRSAEKINLLVSAKGSFPLRYSYLEKGIKKIKERSDNYFDSIYIVCPKKNILVFEKK